MEPEPTDDPLCALAAEEVTRADGRYVIYYHWPAESDPTTAAADRPTTPDAGADV